MVFFHIKWYNSARCITDIHVKIPLAGLLINNETKSEILTLIEDRLTKGEQTVIVTPYSEFFYYANHDPLFQRVINSADFALPDGIGVLWLAYFLSLPFDFPGYYLKIIEAFLQMVVTGIMVIANQRQIKTVLPEKISGSEFVFDLAEFAERKKLRLFLLGGFGDTPELTARALLKRYPNLIIAGYSNGLATDTSTIAQINQSNADIVMVAFGPVVQEKWIVAHKDELTAKIYIGLGGTFDYLAGKKSYAPKVIREMGLEWLYRLISQPQRYNRIWHATYDFVRGAIREKVFLSLPFRESVAGVILNSENNVLVASLRNPVSHRDTETVEYQYDWQFPQGGIEQGETADQAVLREIAEEVGLSDLMIIGQSSYIHHYYWHNYRRALFRRHLKKAKGQTQKFIFLRTNEWSPIIILDQDTGSSEHRSFDEYRWVSIEELGHVMTPPRSEVLPMILQDLTKLL